MCSIVFANGSLSHASENWMRYPAISPDAKTIAFSFHGDIWTVPTTGGDAKLVTSHSSYEKSPVWSQDGKNIVFASNRHGNFDLYVVPSIGGKANRLTFHSANDIPTAFSPDGKEVLFTSGRQDRHTAVIGTTSMEELYTVPVKGGRPNQIMTTSANFASFSPDGKKIAFHDYKGYEDNLRKHHVSSVTRDVWTYEIASGKYKKLSEFAGEDRNPVWSVDGKAIFFLSEENGTFNVWKVNASDASKRSQVTNHAIHPVRFLSRAEDGTLCYGFNGEIWVRSSKGKSSRVDVTTYVGRRENDTRLQTFRDNATEFVVSPNEEEIALVVRGEVYVASVEFGTTKQITNTATQERSLSWGDDRTLYYAAEREGSWNIYKTSIVSNDEDGFANSTLLKEDSVLVSDEETFQPVVSPDGKKLAYLRNRIELRVLDVKTNKSSELVPGKVNFSYTDGDIEYAWSPDSRWLTFTYHGHKSWTSEIGAVNLADGKIVNISDSGYAESTPKFASNGTALLYQSDRYGMRSHGSWGSENDILALYLNQAAYDEATLSKRELALKKKKADKQKKANSKKTDEPKRTTAGKEPENKAEESKPIDFDTNDLPPRLRRITLMSASVGDFALTDDGEALVYTARIDNEWGLWINKVRDRSTTKALSLGSSGPGELYVLKDGKKAILRHNGGKISKIDLTSALSGGKASPKSISFSAEMVVDGPAERAYIFEHAWRQTLRKFYDPKMHGVDWKAMKENYEAFLPSINNNYDFADLLGEMLGELNASHTGGRYRPRRTGGSSTASFGLFYDVKHKGVGLRVAEVMEKGPCDIADTQIAPGVMITHINGVKLTRDVNPWKLLDRQSDKPVRLSLHHPTKKKEWDEVITPFGVSAERELLYQRWIKSRRELCDKLSGGKVGYVHVKGMNDASFRKVYSDTLGVNNEKQALIVDTRFNGGGWLHDDLITFLNGDTYCYFLPRDHEVGDLGGEPAKKWTKPVCVLQSESNYSDAHFFPWAFKAQKVGKLIGAPVPGTATAVWWETQIDSAIVFGIPQVGIKTVDGKYLENMQLEPDVLVINDPESVSRGKDKQLAVAVKEMLKEIAEQK